MKICRQCRYFYHGHKGEPTLCTNRHSKKFPHKISRNGHDHVCALFRPIKNHRHFPGLPEIEKKDSSHHHRNSVLTKHHHPPGLLETLKLKRIERLRGTYTDREIWILATGPSLDDVPHDFLRIDETIPPDKNGNMVPKISIAVKEAAMIFPDCTYNIWPFHTRLLKDTYLFRGQITPNFNKFIFSIRKNEDINFFGKQSLKATYIRFIRGGTVERMKSMCDAIVAGNSSVYFGIGTITHLAIASALIMGASKISLIGCEHGAVGDKLRAQNIKGGFGWQSAVGEGYEVMKIGTNFLADYFRDHGVEIVRYYPGKGYEPIGKVLEEDEE